MSAIEAVASLLILINVWLIARREIWNYAFGIVGVILYAWIFYDAKLYSDMLLQGFFLVVQFYGWANWSASRRRAGEVEVERLDWRARLLWSAGALVAIVAWGTAMHRFTDASYPWWDAAEAILSVVAQILLSQRKLENWLLWIVVDLLSAGLYAAKGLWPTMLLYAILLALAIWGLWRWRRAEAIGGEAMA